MRMQDASEVGSGFCWEILETGNRIVLSLLFGSENHNPEQ
jgi:hypothetical protein